MYRYSPIAVVIAVMGSFILLTDHFAHTAYEASPYVALLMMIVPAIVRWVANLFAALTRHTRHKTVETVHGKEPLGAWKYAKLVPDADCPFEPLHGRPLYAASDAAQCAFSHPGPLPHEGKNRLCGFFGFMRRSAARRLFVYWPYTLCQVEFWGTVLEGSRGVYRAQYQRVLGVYMVSACTICRYPLPRPANCFQLNRKGELRSSCGRHGSETFDLAYLRNLTKTDVEWFNTWFTRLCRLVWPS